AVELHVVAKAADQVSELRLGFRRADFVRDLERHGHDAAGIVGQRRRRQQNEVRPAAQTVDDLRRALLPRKFPEIFLDVLDLECALLEAVLRDAIPHGGKPPFYPTRPHRRRRDPVSVDNPCNPTATWIRKRSSGDRQTTVRSLLEVSCPTPTIG